MDIEYSLVCKHLESEEVFSDYKKFERSSFSHLHYDYHKEFKECVKFLELIYSSVTDFLSKDIDLVQMKYHHGTAVLDFVTNFEIHLFNEGEEVLRIYSAKYFPELICSVKSPKSSVLKHIPLPTYYFIPFNEVLVEQLMNCLNEAIE